MNFKTKEEVMVAYKNGELAEWELKHILEQIEFRENASEIAKLCLKHME